MTLFHFSFPKGLIHDHPTKIYLRSYQRKMEQIFRFMIRLGTFE